MGEPTKVTEIHRLNKETYDALERLCTTLKPTTQTTAIEAGFVMGEQSVLKKLRDGFVIG